jgi:hypothetical protein
MAGRRKVMAKRTASGRISVKGAVVEMATPSEVYRLREGAKSGLRAAEWGTMLGLLNLRGQISDRQYAAGKRWTALTEDYATACQAPQVPSSARLDATRSATADCDSDAGRREARRHARITAAYIEALQALEALGRLPLRLVRAVCETDQAPAGWAELEALKSGLTALANRWTERTKTR